MGFAAGSLVRARGREWVVLPGSTDELVLVRPVAGLDEETTGILASVERVYSTTLAPPGPDDIGDFVAARLLQDALRLSFRASAGPLLSLTRIAVEPRPYQLVPLLMALRMDPVRLLVADDVGVGKTIEACLIAKELLERGLASRLTVLCLPHLTTQWERELREHFHLEAVRVAPQTAARLERGLRIGESLFERYPVTVVSTDFIKSDRRWQEFVRACPELVIVDEAHTCADPQGGRGRHQRYRLLQRVAEDPRRHLILLTATPHSGHEQAFRTLLGFLNPRFAQLPEDLSGPERQIERRRLARHLVQRRRGDLAHYLGEETPFPHRDERERTYTLSAEYRAFLERVVRYCRERVQDPSGTEFQQRVRWWAAIGLLRAAASSPPAAAGTLSERAKSAGATSPEEADAVGRRHVFDEVDEEAEATDVTPGAAEETAPQSPAARRLLQLAREAEALAGAPDRKLGAALSEVKELLADGHNPIVFCKFIPTAEYVARALREALPQDVAIECVTGRLPAEDRETRVEALRGAPRRVLVATDCLAEGINLQELFDAVLHYDLAWNPTRHEQREGRVDRFGQPRKVVRTVMLYGSDNPVDGIVLEVLLRKHVAIRNALGVAVPVPSDPDAVLSAILEGLLLRGRPEDTIFEQLELFDRDVIAPRRREVHQLWDRAAERERRSRTIFAQEGIHPDEVTQALQAVRRAAGGPREVERFVVQALEAHGAVVQHRDGFVDASLEACPRILRDALGSRIRGRFVAPVGQGEQLLARTSPQVETLASFVLEGALERAPDARARRAGVVRTRAVHRRTTLLVLRLRFDLAEPSRDGPRTTLAEDWALAAFEGAPEEARWLPDEEAERLLDATPDANVLPELARQQIETMAAGLPHLSRELEALAERRAGELVEAHRRVRQAGGAPLRGLAVTPRLPVDALGLYVFLPTAEG